MTIDFELRPYRSYATFCPSCGPNRKKRGTKSLSVYRDEDAVIRFKCNHPDDTCAYQAWGHVADPSPADVARGGAVSFEAVPLPDSVMCPTEWNGNRVHVYRDEEGRDLYGVVRVEDVDGRKKFFPLMYNRALQKWESGAGVKYPENARVYGLEFLKNANKVIIVEGEKACDAANARFARAGFAALTWRGGAQAADKVDWSFLNDKEKVFIWPDHDSDGLKAGAILSKLIPANVYLCDVSRLPNKYDLADPISDQDVIDILKSAVKIEKIARGFDISDLTTQHKELNNRNYTYFSLVDEKLSLPGSGVVVIEGRTGHGKSALAINIAHNWLRNGHKVLSINYEMPASRVFNRFLKLQDPYTDLDVLYKEQKFGHLKQYIEEQQLLLYDQSKQLDADELIKFLNTPVLAGHLIIIDYVQIIPLGRGYGERHRLLKEKVIDPLRKVANANGFLVLLLSQLTPDYSNALNDTPRECKDIHMSAETVIRIWNNQSLETHSIFEELDDEFFITIKKNRDGESNLIFGCDFLEGGQIVPKRLVTHKKQQKKQSNSFQSINDINSKIDMLVAKQAGGVM